MITQRLMRKVEEAGFLDAVAGPVEGIANKALQSDGVRDSLTGRWLGHPVHPAISDAPVGFFTAATILDFMPGNETAVKRLIAAGLAVTAPTAASGVAEWVYTIGGQKRIGLAHAGFNTLGAALYAASLAARTNGGSLQAKVLGMAGWLSLACGAYTGGHIAHSMGIGVDQTAFETPPTDWTTVCEESAVGEAPIAVQAGDVPVMVVRDKGEIKALANRCTHRGGPLNEGRIDDGCVVCPWHQSTFDLSTGEIRRGPAASPQPAFETRVIDGAVQVRVKPETVA